MSVLSTPPENLEVEAVSPLAAIQDDVTLQSLRQSGTRLAVESTTPMRQLLDLLKQHPGICGVLVLDEGKLAGIIWRDGLARNLSRPFALELYKHKTVAEFITASTPPPLVLPESSGIATAVEAAMQRDPETRYAPIVVEAGIGDWYLLDVHAMLIKQCQILGDALQNLQRQREELDRAQRDREQLHQRLLEASREAGRAEVATGVLHNVGNVLNSVNASASLIHRTLQQSKLGNLGRAVTMINQHTTDLGQFLETDERGKALPAYLGKLTDVLTSEQKSIVTEVESLGRSLEHIKQVVQMQQSYAKGSNVIEPVRPADLLEDALRVNMVSCDRHHVHIVRQFQDVPPVSLDRHKILQILVNLVSNAKNATKFRPPETREITVRLETIEQPDSAWVQFEVSDNGEGIAPENLTRIFSLGFTTRKEGHGFGLHSAANAAAEMGGSLTAASDGHGCGATLTLRIPLKSAVVCGGRA